MRRTLTLTALAVFVSPIFIMVVAICLSAYGGNAKNSELFSTLLSVSFAGLAWLVAVLILRREFRLRFLFLLTMTIVLIILINYLHFYFLFSPLAGVSSSADLSNVNFSGDLAIQSLAVSRFIDYVANEGWVYAIFGDYYRGFNNPGVPVLFGSMYIAFGEYGSVAIPWSVLAQGMSGLVAGLLAMRIGATQRNSEYVALLVVLMPGFLVIPPLYRDKFIVLLILMSVLIAISAHRANIIFVAFMIAVCSLFLFSLRAVYFFLPSIFFLFSIYYFNESGKQRYAITLIFAGFLAFFLFFVFDYLAGDFFNRFGDSLSSEESNFSILQPFKSMGPLVYYPVAAIFSLLSPMPWWQVTSPTILSYQVFTYMQTAFSLVVIGCAFDAFIHKKSKKYQLFFSFCFMVIFGLALFGSKNLGSGYFQIAIPLLIIANIAFILDKWKSSFLWVIGVLVSSHFVLFVKDLL